MARGAWPDARPDWSQAQIAIVLGNGGLVFTL